MQIILYNLVIVAMPNAKNQTKSLLNAEWTNYNFVMIFLKIVITKKCNIVQINVKQTFSKKV